MPEKRKMNDRKQALETIQTFSDVSYEAGDQHTGTISMRDMFVQNKSLSHIANVMIAQQKSTLRKQERSEYRYYTPWLEHLHKTSHSGKQIRQSLWGRS